jgi:hypothetical protein
VYIGMNEDCEPPENGVGARGGVRVANNQEEERMDEIGDDFGWWVEGFLDNGVEAQVVDDIANLA